MTKKVLVFKCVHKSSPTCFNQVGEVTITKDDTLLLKGKGTEDHISRRVEQIKDAIENSTSDYEKEKMQERLARLSSGVAILKVKSVVF